MKPSRRDLIAAAFNKPPEVHPQQGVIKHALKESKDHLPVGQATNFLQAMNPQERGLFGYLYCKHSEAEDLGRHAKENTSQLLERAGCEPVVSKLLDAIDTDTVAHELMKRRGDDSSLPIEPPTRRDILSAAIGD